MPGRENDKSVESFGELQIVGMDGVWVLQGRAQAARVKLINRSQSQCCEDWLTNHLNLTP